MHVIIVLCFVVYCAIWQKRWFVSYKLSIPFYSFICIKLIHSSLFLVVIFGVVACILLSQFGHLLAIIYHIVRL